jgi:hypothetical protein
MAAPCLARSVFSFYARRSSSVAVCRQVNRTAHTSLNRSHSPDTQMVPAPSHRGAPLGVSDILVKGLSYDEQPLTSYKVAHRNYGSFTFLYEFNTNRLAHCDSITHTHQQMRTFIWNHKSPIHKNTPTRFSDKLPFFVLASPRGRWYIAETCWRVHGYRRFLILHNLGVFVGAYGDCNYNMFSFYTVQKNVNTLHAHCSRNM